MTADSSSTFDVRSAFDGTLLKTLPRTSEGQAFAALQRAHELHAKRDGWLDAPSRMAILRRLVELVGEQKESLVRQAAAEGGKPYKDSLVEVERAMTGIETAIAEITQLTGTEIPMRINAGSAHRFAHTYREPRGVVLAISAFNHPFNLIVHQVVTAIAAGCPVLVKPASSTPLSCRSIVSMLSEAGLPDGWCQVIHTENEVTEKLVSDTRVSFMTFIGSARVGWHLRSKLAPGAACAMEHGGVAPVIVDETADLDDAIPLLTRGGFYHAGQVCVSVQRVYVHRSIMSEFTTKLLSAAKALKTGDPLESDTDVGPLISEHELERVDQWVHEAVAGGAELACGGHQLSKTTYAPTILINPPIEAKVSQQEIFGPVVALYTYDDMDDAIAQANGPDVFFQAAIFTRDLDTALSVSRRLHGMAVMVNDHSAFRVDWMPFGGHRQSGLGMGGIGHSMRDMTLERMVVFRSRLL